MLPSSLYDVLLLDEFRHVVHGVPSLVRLLLDTEHQVRTVEALHEFGWFYQLEALAHVFHHLRRARSMTRYRYHVCAGQVFCG